MMSIGHGALNAPIELTGGAALGDVSVPKSQHKLDQLAEKMKAKSETKKSEDKIDPAPTSEKESKDWETIIGEKINHFSQLLRSEVVKLKLKKLKDKIQ